MFASSLRAAAFAAALLIPGAALAGPQYVDSTGYALSGYDTVAYFSLEQAPVGEAQPKAVPGDARYTAEWNGAKWAFASAENRDAFLADPERYAPQYDGHCAYGASVGDEGRGGKVPGNPHLWRIIDGKLYVNILPRVAGWWEQDITGHITKADGNWLNIGDATAASNNVPKFDAALAPK